MLLMSGTRYWRPVLQSYTQRETGQPRTQGSLLATQKFPRVAALLSTCSACRPHVGGPGPMSRFGRWLRTAF